MDITVLLANEFFNWVIMPFLIFLARIFDVSFGTIRVVFISQGMKKFAAVMAFFEVFVWILVARQVITNMNNFMWIIGYCFGYATGTYIGIIICDKINTGKVTVRIIVKEKADEIISALKEKNFGLTVINAEGKMSQSKVIFSIVSIKDLDELIKTIKSQNPKAFYSVEPVRMVSEQNCVTSSCVFKKGFPIPNLMSFRKIK